MVDVLGGGSVEAVVEAVEVVVKAVVVFHDAVGISVGVPVGAVEVVGAFEVDACYGSFEGSRAMLVFVVPVRCTA